MKLRKYFPLNIAFSFFFSLFAFVLLFLFPGKLITSLSGIIFSLILPGYLLIEALWPLKFNNDRTWNRLLIIPANITIVSGILLIIHYFWEYSLERVYIFILVFNILMIFICVYHFSTPNDRGLKGDASKSINIPKGKITFSVPHILLAFSLLILFFSITYASVISKKTSEVTEFYVLNTDRSLPLSIKNQQQATDLILGVFNHEGKTIKYSLEIQAVHQSGYHTVFFEEFYIQNEELIEPSISIPPLPSNTHELRLLLFKDDINDPYLDLKILIE